MKHLIRLVPKFVRQAIADLVEEELARVDAATVMALKAKVVILVNRVLGLAA
jgi:hypothetical protein